MNHRQRWMQRWRCSAFVCTVLGQQSARQITQLRTCPSQSRPKACSSRGLPGLHSLDRSSRPVRSNESTRGKTRPPLSQRPLHHFTSPGPLHLLFTAVYPLLFRYLSPPFRYLPPPPSATYLPPSATYLPLPPSAPLYSSSSLLFSRKERKKKNREGRREGGGGK